MEYPSEVLLDKKISAGAKVLYGFLMLSAVEESRAGERTVLLGRKEMAQALGSSVRTMSRWMRELEKKGLVVTTPRGGKAGENWMTILQPLRTVYSPTNVARLRG